MKKHLKTILVVILIFLAIGFILFRIVKSKVDEVGGVNNAYAQYAFATYSVKKEDVNTYIKGTGTISSFNIETLSVDVGETVTDILVE